MEKEKRNKEGRETLSPGLRPSSQVRLWVDFTVTATYLLLLFGVTDHKGIWTAQGGEGETGARCIGTENIQTTAADVRL